MVHCAWASASSLVQERTPFEGLALESVRERIEKAVERFVPRSMAQMAERLEELIAYTIFRFSSASMPELASALDMSLEATRDAICRIRGELAASVGWQRLLWGLEWSLRWSLRAGPHRA